MKLPFIQSPGQRAALLTEDDLLINCYPEQLADGRVAVVKRHGATLYSSPASASTPRGLWVFNGETVSIFGSKLYHNTTEIGTNLISGTGPCWATEYGTSTKYLAITNGTNAWRISTGWSSTAVSDGDFQSHVAGIAHLDGYLFTLATSGQVAHSDLRDVTNWNPLNVLNAESLPDAGIFIDRHINYITAFGKNSIEFFYDAANDTGSVLSRVSGALLHVGCIEARTVCSIKGMQVFVSDGGAVYVLNNMALERVSIPAIERIISASTITDAFAQAYEVDGHSFYMLTLPTSNRTLAYDFSSKKWWFAQDTSGNYWPYVYAAQDGVNVYFQRADGKIYKASGTQDAGSNYTITARTGWVDFGTGRRKHLPALEVLADIGAGDISVRYSTDDYGTWSTARTKSLAKRAEFRQFGELRRIAFEFSYTHSDALRLIEVDANVYTVSSRRGKR